MNTEQLKQAAMAATPGPWIYVRLDEWSHSVCTKHGELPDGSLSDTPTAMWAEEWKRKIAKENQ